MHALHIALQDGFIDDEVAVSLDGAQLYHANNLSTPHQVGLAGSFATQIMPGPHTIEVRLPRRPVLRKVQSLSVYGDTWLGITLRSDGHFNIHVSATPFGYL